VDRYVQPFAEPDELIELSTVRSELITRAGMTVSHDIQQPGWRWSTHIRPLVKTEWCEVRHLGVLVRGHMRVLLSDGSEFEVGPMSLMDIPAGHDAWVVGHEPVETIAWTRVKEWLKPLDTMGERVLVTLVFTDLVDSTATAARLGRDAWGELLADHDRQARDIVTRFRGRTVKSTGDGILATFDGAARAVRCAIALREAALGLGLEMRTAVHTGEVDMVDDDIRGIAIHQASRTLGLASAGQILVSSSTAGLVGDTGIELEDVGVHELRGIGTPQQIFAVA
jgi:class 3 adenylate cyclase